MTPQEREDLQAELSRLQGELEERKANVPAHTVRPHQLLILEELEERIAELRRRLGEA